MHHCQRYILAARDSPVAHTRAALYNPLKHAPTDARDAECCLCLRSCLLIDAPATDVPKASCLPEAAAGQACASAERVCRAVSLHPLARTALAPCWSCDASICNNEAWW